MIKSFTVTNFKGESVDIILGRPEKSGFLLYNAEGLGASEGDIITTQVATNDGAIFNSSRVNQRNIVLYFKLLPTSYPEAYAYEETIENTRHRLYRYFPVKRKLRLLVETDVRKSYIEGYVESNSIKIFSNSKPNLTNSSTAQISIICPDPYFKDVNTETLYFSGIEPIFEFPFENEGLSPDTEIGAIHIDKVRSITYSGDVETGVIIDIHAMGAASNITIYNETTRESMAIKETLEPLDSIIVSTLNNNKYINLLRHGVSTSILNKIDKNSDWFTLTKGINTFSYIAEEGVDNLEFSVITQVLYEGV